MAKQRNWLDLMTKLRVDRSRGAAPHKPRMLLVVVDLAENGELRDSVLRLTPELVFRFSVCWSVVAHRRSQPPDVRLPLHHLHSDGFWTPYTKSGENSPHRTVTSYVELDPEFTEFLGSSEHRQQARRVLIANYFEPAERTALYALFGMRVPTSDEVVRDAKFCHSEWYRDLIAKHRGPANQSPIVMWPYPIDPWPGEPLPDEYDLLIYAKNGHRPMLLEHLAELFPRHIQIHYGQYHRDQLFDAARRSRACAYLADDDHGPLALQEILLAGCPTVGVRTGASFVKTGETGVLVDRLPPGRQCVKTEADRVFLEAYLNAIRQAKEFDRSAVRHQSSDIFCTENIVELVVTTLDAARKSSVWNDRL